MSTHLNMQSRPPDEFALEEVRVSWGLATETRDRLSTHLKVQSHLPDEFALEEVRVSWGSGGRKKM